MNRFLIFLGVAALLPAFPLSAGNEAPNLEPVEKWLAFQRSIRSVEAEFVQFRELRTLRNPLRSEGKVWIDYRGERFRWQAGLDGGKPRTIAAKSGETLTILIPAGKKARRVDLKEAARRQGGPEAAFDLAAGEMPDTLPALKQAFEILDVTGESGAWRVRLRPKNSQLRQSIGEAVFVVDAEKHFLRGIDLTFRDGSRVKTTFTRQRFNVRFEDSLFEPDLSGYTFED